MDENKYEYQEWGLQFGILTGLLALQWTGQVLWLVLLPAVGFAAGSLLDRLAARDTVDEDWFTSAG